MKPGNQTMLFSFSYVPILVLAVAALIAFLAWVGAVSASLVRHNTRVVELWKGVETILEERGEEIRKLVHLCASRLKRDRALLEELDQAGKALLDSREDPAEAAAIGHRLEDALHRLLERAGRSEGLGENQAFRGAVDRITGAQSRLARARDAYNEAAARFNARIGSFPHNILAGALDYEERRLFKA